MSTGGPRGTTTGSDPALEVGSDGRTLLQSRLALFGKVMVILNLTFWPGFLLLWGNEPSAWRSSLMGRGSMGLWIAVNMSICLLLWGLTRGRPRPKRALLVIDAGITLAIGLWFALNKFVHPQPLFGVYDAALAVMALLLLRALLVPSSWPRTLVLGLLTMLPQLVTLASFGRHFTMGLTGPAPLIGSVVNWSLMVVGLSALASGVLYSLRREVRDARVLGQYTLLEKLGEGGMGVVYRARHALLRRPTAIKLLSPDRGSGNLQRFEQEVQILASLNHPNTVAIHDYGHTADGTFYYVMEYLDGADLERLVKVDGPQPAGRVLHILGQACQALAEAHAAGLIHRDVKPANIFLCRHWGRPDVVKVLDFGIAKQLGEDEVGITGAAALLGTPLYMAPEAATAPATVDTRSDLYSLGAVGYWLLSGRPVFGGSTPLALWAHHIHTAPPPLPEGAPPDLQAVLSRCLAKSPDDRYPSALALGEALAACRDAGSWSPEQATSWWRDRGDAIAASRTQAHQPPSSATIAIDPRQRAPQT